MKWYRFKYILMFTVQLSAVPAFTQSNYERRIEKRQSFWEHLIPTHHQIQYAGGMGLLSCGTGWGMATRTGGKQTCISVFYLAIQRKNPNGRSH
jgi:hypothetical protein